MLVGPGTRPAAWPSVDQVSWISPEELIREGFRQSRVVMMNEARSGLRRCERTRRIGARIMHMARACGASLLAVEAMGPPEGPLPTGGVLAQPDMIAMLEEARLQGFELSGYDADQRNVPVRLRTKVKSPGYVNWHDGQQAANLARLFETLPEGAGMLVWCSGLHHAKVRFMAYRPMGWLFMQQTKVPAFAIDQTVAVDFTGRQTGQSPVLKWAAAKLMERGDAGYVWQDGLPRLSAGCDAWILSLDNRVT